MLSRSIFSISNSTKFLAKFSYRDETQARCIKRWVAPTLRELRRRDKLVGPQEPQPRSGFIEWNYRAELSAFSKRLKEDFQLPILQAAFTQRSYVLKEQQRQRDLGVEEADIQMRDNCELAEHGTNIIKEYVDAYLQHFLPNVPTEGHTAIGNYLISVPTLAHVSKHLGMTDLLFAVEYPPTEESKAQSLKAIVGALERSSGMERAYLFVRDFICTQLNQRDLLDLWEIENPEQLLAKVCKERKLSAPEPRLIEEFGKNTVLAAYMVGIYVDKKLIGKACAENIAVATKTASLNALQKLFDMEDNRRPFNFKINVEPKNSRIQKN